MLDSKIVAVSLPAISRSLGASFTEVQWVISAYVLTPGDLSGMLAAAPSGVRESLRSFALAAYGAGCGSAALVACLLAFGLISGEETAPL